MRVGIVCPYSMAQPGGVQEHARGLARALVASGVDVMLFAPELRDRTDALGGAQPISLGGAVSIPANGSIAPLGIDPRMLIRYDLGLDPVDVLHLHEPFLPASLFAMLRRPKGVPVVGTFHAAAERFWPYAITAPVLRRLATRLGATTAVSPAAAELVRRYVPQVDPTLVPNGVDTAAFASAVPDPFASDLGRVVLFVGRPEPRKGFDVVLQSFAAVARTHPDVHLVCVPATAEDAAKHGADQDRVHALGPVSRDRLYTLHRAAEIVLCASLGGESFGNVVIEGQAGGSAVIASDIPGYRFAGGDAARYVQPGDIVSWIRALGALLDDEAERRRLREAGVAHAASYDWARIAAKTLAVYERVA
jgi:phosphatidyl-myo-inositol alpha-mannosyltransferase